MLMSDWMSDVCSSDLPHSSARLARVHVDDRYSGELGAKSSPRPVLRLHGNAGLAFTGRWEGRVQSPFVEHTPWPAPSASIFPNSQPFQRQFLSAARFLYPELFRGTRTPPTSARRPASYSRKGCSRLERRPRGYSQPRPTDAGAH